MNKITMMAVMLAYFVAVAADDAKPQMVKIGGEGKLVFINSSHVEDVHLESVASMISKILMINAEVEKGAWSMADAKKNLASIGASAAVFVVDDPKLPMSLIAMEEKWGVANAAGLNGENASKEALRVATVVLGGASSKYAASVMRPVFTKEDLASKAGSVITIDALMAIYPNLASLGIKQFTMMDYADALEDGVAPPPANDAQRKLKANFEKTRSAKK